MAVLVGTPSDDVSEILATGQIDITTVFVSMTARHPEGRDADMEKRWADAGVAPLLAAPFHTIVPCEWDRYVP